MNEGAKFQIYGRWQLDVTPPVCLYIPGPVGVGVFLTDLTAGEQHRDRWIHRVVAGMAGITDEDIKDLERTAAALGRAATNISVKNISDALRHSNTVASAAELLAERYGKCSKGYIYQEMGKAGINPRDLLKTSVSEKVGVTSRLNGEGN